jgi:hypothetical protein
VDYADVAILVSLSKCKPACAAQDKGLTYTSAQICSIQSQDLDRHAPILPKPLRPTEIVIINTYPDFSGADKFF